MSAATQMTTQVTNQITTHITTLETLLQQWQPNFGNDYIVYRNHVYRIINHCIVYARKNDIPLNHDTLEIIAIAAAFHDIGIWLDNTFDYLQPSAQRANNYLVREGKASWINTITGMINEHHKITSFSSDKKNLVEMFRQADWIDVSMGTLNFQIPWSNIREIRKVFPYEGFHKRLIQLTLAHTIKTPLNPLPMFKW